MTDVETQSLRRQVVDLTNRCAMLQQHVDRDAPATARNIVAGVVDAGSAQGALDVYDHDWFESTPYSRAARGGIALSMLAALAPYPFLDVQYLRDLLPEAPR